MQKLTAPAAAAIFGIILRSWSQVFLVIAGVAIVGAAQAPSPVEVHGVVRDATTGKVIPRASVQLGRLYKSSDVEGRFSIQGVVPGNQLLMVFRDDYQLAGIHKPDPGQRPVYRQGGLNVVIPPVGPFEMDVYLNLAPQVSGTLVDSDGRPVEGIYVTAYKSLYGSNGERLFVRALAPAALSATDDRGEFVVRSLPPGDYVFRADNEFLSRKVVVPTYYPSGTDASKAQIIHLKAGDDIQLRPLVVENARLLQLIVKATNEAGDEVGVFDVSVRRKGESAGLSFRNPVSGLVRLPSGSYEIEVGGVQLDQMTRRTRLTKITRTSFEMRDADLVLPITLRSGTRTTIRVQHERDGQLTTLTGIPVRLVPTGFFATNPPFDETSGPDGTVTFPDVSPGLYRVQLPLYSETDEPEALNTRTFASAPQNVCVRDIRLNDTHAAGDEVNITGNTANVTVILRDSSTRIQGKLGARGANSTVALVPQDPKQIQKYVAALADDMGNFELKCAVPGDYRLYAWTDLPGAAYRNEQFMADYRDQGTPVRVAESESITVQTTVIER